jgi:hypothetical protein
MSMDANIDANTNTAAAENANGDDMNELSMDETSGTPARLDDTAGIGTAAIDTAETGTLERTEATLVNSAAESTAAGTELCSISRATPVAAFRSDAGRSGTAHVIAIAQAITRGIACCASSSSMP